MSIPPNQPALPNPVLYDTLATSQIPNTLSDQAIQEAKKDRKRWNDAERLRIKRQRTMSDNLDNLEMKIPLVGQPEKYLLYDAPANTASFMIVQYFHNLQLNDMIARPTNWSSILNSVLIRKKYDSIPQPESKLFLSDHPWHRASLNHYHPVSTESELKTQLDKGLPLPVLILPGTSLSTTISSQSIWSTLPHEKILDTILKDKSAKIEIQDHSLSDLGSFTIAKTCEEVRSRFNIRIEDRGLPWNCLDIGDRLLGFKGPKVLQYGANLRDWQYLNPQTSTVDRDIYAPLPNHKSLDRWLLISEKHSASIAHIDIGVATWVSCLTGKKTFWIRNPSIKDRRIWEEQDIEVDHRFYSEPWARIDLYPGTTL